MNINDGCGCTFLLLRAHESISPESALLARCMQTSAAQASQSFTDPEPIDTKNDLMKDGQMMKEKC